MHFSYVVPLLQLLPLGVLCQQRGSVSPEVHPTLTVSKCTKKKCVASTKKIVLDANWRWLHNTTGYNNCFSGSWDPTLCPDPVTCSQNCALDGADYTGTYGINANGGDLTLQLYPSGSVGSRVYLLADDDHYQVFKLKNQEFTFDVDVSGLPCGTNGALYFSNMQADGGQSAFPNNKAGAHFGTGYCDAQCPQDIKFINGEANLLNWNSGSSAGKYGSCCAEMDIWEANSASTAYTAHPCSAGGQTRCDSATSACASTCDKSGCDFNPYRLGNKTFYGPSTTSTLKTSAPNKLRVTTAFITSNGSPSGALTEIRRTYRQNGQVIANAASKVKRARGNSLSDAFCAAEKSAFGESNDFAAKGGMGSFGDALDAGMVLTMSVWVDYGAHMLWLDSNYPVGAPPKSPGVQRGPCPTDSGNPDDVRNAYPDAQVTFSNVRYGDIGTTAGAP